MSLSLSGHHFISIYIYLFISDLCPFITLSQSIYLSIPPFLHLSLPLCGIYLYLSRLFHLYLSLFKRLNSLTVLICPGIFCTSARIPRKNINLQQNQYKFQFRDLSLDFGFDQGFKDHYVRKINVLDAVEDEYNGMIVDPDKLPRTPSTFASLLRTSLLLWRLQVFKE